MVKDSDRTGGGCKTHPVTGASQDLNLSHQLTCGQNSSLKVWLISLYIFLCQFYSSCRCSARNEQSKEFSLLVSLWDVVCLGFPVIIRLLDDFLIYDFIVYPVLSHFWE